MSHCPHRKCCQCGAKTGTPEHDVECPDVAVRRAMNKRSEGYVSRKLPAQWMLCLARNLEIGAWLCEAWTLGVRFGQRDLYHEEWLPGCKRNAR